MKIAIHEDDRAGMDRFFSNKVVLALESKHSAQEVLEWISAFNEE